MTSDKDLTSELEWVQLRKDLDDYEGESQLEKLKRKTKENPLIPIGTLVTTGAIVCGLRFMLAGDSKKQQAMMRLRVGAQGFTILVCAFGLASAAKRKLNKNNN